MKLKTKEEAQKDFIVLKQKAEVKVATLGLGNQTAQVVCVMDISGSMTDLFRQGVVQAVCERALALGVQFDDDGVIPIYLFGENSHPAIELTEKDFYGYVDREILKKYSLEYNTLYAKPLKRIVEDHFPKAIGNGTAAPKKKGFFGSIFSSGDSSSSDFSVTKLSSPVQDPVFVIYITDGNNNDETRTEKIIREASKLPMFIQFIGVGRQSFHFLKKLDEMEGRFIDNAGFCQIQDPANISDEEFLAEMLNEFPEYIQGARSKGLIV